MSMEAATSLASSLLQQKDKPSLQQKHLLTHNGDISFKQVIIFLVAYLGTGTFVFCLAQNAIDGKKTNSAVLDSIYLSVVTMTTVGYGDLVPKTVPAKLLACLYVFSGMAFGALILSKGADYLVEKQENVMMRAIHMLESSDIESRSNKLMLKNILKEFESSKAKSKFISVSALLMVLVAVGIIFLSIFEDLDPVDAFYCVCSTITTLGYGDYSFTTTAGRVFAIFWILSSTVCLAQFFFYLAELYTERRRQPLINWVLTRKLTASDLASADLDNDNSVR